MSVVEERMVNTFEVGIDATEDEGQPLINIATSEVAKQIAKSL